MASKEYLQERIDRAKENIGKKEALISKMSDRIAKNMSKLQKMGYTAEEIEVGIDNPYRMDDHNPNYDKAFDLCYSIGNAQESIHNAEKALPELREKLARYEADMRALIEKANSRDIAVILEFLDNWKARMTQFYAGGLREYFAEKEHVRDLARIHESKKYGTPEYEKAKEEYEAAWKEHFSNCEGAYEYVVVNPNSKYSWERTKKVKVEEGKFEYLKPYSSYDTNDEALARLARDLNQEADAKYDFIIERTNDIVGQITDAGFLSIGAKGDLNGYIVGTRGKAKVQTIGAGGYNIQCYHFRTLIHAMK